MLNKELDIALDNKKLNYEQELFEHQCKQKQKVQIIQLHYEILQIIDKDLWKQNMLLKKLIQIKKMIKNYNILIQTVESKQNINQQQGSIIN